jgi:prepilin-type N-terminal cleavage/methylation domain-containing protein
MIERIRARLARQEGFTLIELLITLILMGIVMGAVTTAFASAFTGEARSIGEATNEENARLALHRLRMDIHCASFANGATPNTNGDGGYTFVLTEIYDPNMGQACPKVALGVEDDGTQSSWVAWCTLRQGGEGSHRYRLYRENVRECNGEDSTFMVDYITKPDIWDTQHSCSIQGWEQYVGVDLVTNLEPSSDVYKYDLHDVIGLRNSDRPSVTPVACLP